MARVIYLDKLLRLTLTRRGKAVAKHPYLRESVIEAVKASQIETTPLWETCKATPEDDHMGAPGMARFQSGRYQ